MPASSLHWLALLPQVPRLCRLRPTLRRLLSCRVQVPQLRFTLMLLWVPTQCWQEREDTPLPDSLVGW